MPDSTLTAPEEARTTSSTAARTTSPTWFHAMLRPIETASPVVPPNPPATEAAPEKDRMPDVDDAPTEAEPTVTVSRSAPVAVGSLMDASTSVLMRFPAKAPATLIPMPLLPPAIPTAPAATNASMVWAAVAVTRSAPPAQIVVSMTRARTCAVLGVPMRKPEASSASSTWMSGSPKRS